MSSGKNTSRPMCGRLYSPTRSSNTISSDHKKTYHRKSLTANPGLKLISLFMLVLWMTGCASVSLRQGRWHLSREEYPQALEALKLALSEAPDNPEIHRDLGIVYYKTGEFEQALEELTAAKKGLEKDGNLIFYLGMTYEQLGEYDKAIEEYTNYVQLARFRKMRRKIQQRVEQLTQQQAHEWAKERIELESKIDLASIPDNTIAVTYFKPIGISEELEPLHIGLTQCLITDLKSVKGLKVVERVRLKEIYRELGFSSTELVDKDTAPRLGRLLGANSLVTGTFTGFGDETWRVDPTLGLIKTGDLKDLEGIEGDLAGFLQVEKDLVFEVLTKLNVEFTDEERDNIMRSIPTESLEAFISYSKGLDYLDKGMYSEAKEEFEAAVSLDSGFDQAKDHLLEAESLSQPIDSIDDLQETLEAVSLSHEVANEVLTTTVEEVSQENEPPVPEPPEQRKVLLRIQW